MRKCVKCYAETDEGAQICKECGSDKFFIEGESTIPCMHCGQANKESEKECLACGHKLVR
jgi:ribosomal protein L40E